MRKSLSIALTSIYILATAGIMVNVHFCCGGLAEISLWSELDPCSCSHDDHDCEHGNSCCDFDSIYLHVDADHNAPASLVVPDNDAVSATPVSVDGEEVLIEIAEFSSSSLRGPPLSRVPIYLAKCSLVFYG